MLGAQLECVREVLRGRFRRELGAVLVGVNDTPVFLLNEYIVELNPANFNILNQILN